MMTATDEDWPATGTAPLRPAASAIVITVTTAGIIGIMLKNAPIVPYIPAADVARAGSFYEGNILALVQTLE